MQYWVVGGEYTDTSFRVFAPGAREERFGPYVSYDEAHAAWSSRARATVDDACVRYRIQAEDIDVAA